MSEPYRSICISGVLMTTLCAVVGGCVKRQETITVFKDGSIELRVEISGDREDMENGAPALAETPGWEFSQEIKKEDKDGQTKEEVVQTAKKTFAPGASLPNTYPTNDPEGERLALQHDTTLVIERRGGDTYYHFHRVYKARTWAYVNYWQHELIEKPIERAGDTPPEEWSPEKKQELVQNIIHVQGLKQLEFARRAALSLDRPLPQDVRLRVHQAVLTSLETVDADQVREQLEKSDGLGHNDDNDNDSGDDDALDALAVRISDQLAQAIRSTLHDAGLSGPTIADFERAMAREARRFAITTDYGDEQWEVEVVMPGRIVAHNGELDESEAKWSFDGPALYDRDIELMATSVVTAAESR